MSAVIKSVKDAVNAGRPVADDSLVLEHERWEKEGKEGPEPGALGGDQLDLFNCRYNGSAKACCKIEAEREKADAEQKKRRYRPRPCKGPFPRLTDDLKEYVLFIHDKVFTKKPPAKDRQVDLLFKYGCKRISRLMPGFARVVKKRIYHDVNTVGRWTDPLPKEALEKKETLADRIAKSKQAPGGPAPYKPPPQVEIVEVCTMTHKQLEMTLRKDLLAIVGKVIPKSVAKPVVDQVQPLSFALLPKVPEHWPFWIRKINRDIGNLKRAIAELGPQAVHHLLACKGGSQPSCHAAAGLGKGIETLKRVLAIAEKERARLSRRGPRNAARRPTKAVSRGISKQKQLTAKRIVVLRKKAQHAIAAALRELHAGLVWMKAFQGSKPKAVRLPGFRKRVSVIQKSTQAALKAMYGPAANKARQALVLTAQAHKATQQATKAGYPKGLEDLESARESLGKAVESIKQAVLWTDLGDYDKSLRGERFHDIAKRILSFHRKAGAARNFARAQRKAQKDVQQMADGTAQSPAAQSPEAQSEIAKQANKDTVRTRTEREVLVKKVDQWTYGYEYEQLAGFVKGASPALLRDYQRAEADVVNDFWSDCLEIQALCQEPKTRRERAACRKCAVHAVRNRCLGGKSKKRCMGFHRQIVPYRGTGVAYATGVWDNKEASGPLKASQIQAETAKRLIGKLQGMRKCFLEEQFWIHPAKDPKNPNNVFNQLVGLAKAGKLTEFQAVFQASVGGCFYCNCGGHAGCRNHYGGPKWHTIHEHCWQDCLHEPFGGSPCRGFCVTGVSIDAWAKEAWKNLAGGAGPMKPGAGVNVNELHELRVGREPVWRLQDALVKCNNKKCQTDTIMRIGSKYWAPKHLVQRWISLGDGKNTFLNWLALQVINDATDINFHGGAGVTNRQVYETDILRNVVERKFLPRQVDTQKGITNRGMQYLNSLPLTEWQRCFLWNPYGEKECDKPQERRREINLKTVQWQKAPLFAMALEHADVNTYIDQHVKYWMVECASVKQVQKKFWFIPIPGTQGQAPKWDCNLERYRAKHRADIALGRKVAPKDTGPDLGAASDAIGQVVGPIVGKLLGMLLKAAGMYEMVKTLGKAAGLTPEQSADCEDPEYRREIMKLPKPRDHKRGCLLKVFAKNFTNVLESIIVMLGNKLVDWGVDLLRTVLQPLKSGLIAAAGSVPFAGGVLAGLVDIGWELIMNFGAKMLLKSFVIAKLPEWMKIKELSTQSFEQLMENPVIQVIVGIIIQLIDAAMTYGDKSWMAVGVGTALSAIQLALIRLGPPAHFWIRALSYAKKEMRKGGGGPDEPLPRQILKLVQNMIKGFGEAIARRIDDETTQGNFRRAVDKIIEETSDPAKIVTKFTAGDPVKAIVGIIGDYIGPVVIPIITAFVEMDPWVKGLLQRIGNALAQTVREIIDEKRPPGAQELIGRIVDILEPAGKDCSQRVICRLLDQLPVEKDLRDMLKKGLRLLANGLRDINGLRELLGKPSAILAGVVKLSGNFIKAKVGEIVPAQLAPEKKLLQKAVGKILQVLADAQYRKKLFAGGPAGAKALMKELAEVIRPYAKARFSALAAGTGLEGLVKDAVDGLLGKQGPFYRGAAFFDGLKQTLSRNASKIAGSVFGAVAGIVDAQAKRLGAGPVLGSIARGVLGALRKVLTSRTGIAGLIREGAANVLGLAKAAFAPLLDAIAPKQQKGPMGGLIRHILGGVLDLLGNPQSLAQLAQRGAAALKRLALSVAAGLRDAVKSVIAKASAIPEPLRRLAGRAVDGFFTLLSDPARIGEIKGAKILGLLKEVGSEIFGFVKEEVIQAIAGVTGQTPKAIQAMIRSVITEVQQLIANPGRLRAMIQGAAKEVVAYAAKMLSTGLQALIESAVPTEVRDVFKRVVGEAIGFLSNPSRLASLARMKAGDLLPKLAPLVHDLLQGILSSAVPAELLAQVKAAIAKVRAALANPAALAAQAGAAARKAIDGVIAATLVRIPDAGLRALASDLIALVRDLVSTGATAKKLRTELHALLGRLVHAGKQYLLSLLPAGPVQQLVTQAIDGLRRFLANPRGVAAALAQKAKALLPSVWRALSGFLQNSIRGAIPNRQAASLVSGLVEEVLGMIGDPTHWKGVTQQGIGYFFSRLIPVARDFIFSALAQATGMEVSALRAVVEGLVSAATRLFSNPKAIGDFAKNAVSSLISMGINSVVPAVLAMVERATGTKSVSRFLRTALDGLAGILRRPAKLGAFLKLKASQAFGELLGHAEKLVTALVDGVIKEPGLKKLAQGGLEGVLAYVRGAVAGGGGDLYPAVKAILQKLIPAGAALVTTKVQGLFPAHLRALGDLVTGGIQKLTAFATRLVKDGKAAWADLTKGGGAIFGKIVKAVLPLLLGPINKLLANSPLAQPLVQGLLTLIEKVLADPLKLQNPAAAKRLVLPALGAALKSFVQKAVVSQVPDGLPRAIVGTIADAGLSLLEPQNLSRFLDQLKKGGKGLIQLAIGGLKSGLRKALDDLTQKAKLPGFVKDIFVQGLDALAAELAKR